MYKKINEENIVSINKLIKKVPINKSFWTTGLTKGKLIKLVENLSDDTPIVLNNNHEYMLTNANIEVAIISAKDKAILEDWGQKQEGAFKRKVIVIV